MGKKNYKLDKRSTRETFEQWLNECCGHNLEISELGSINILSCFGVTDGYTVDNDTIAGDVHFNYPQEVEDFLIEEEYYEDKELWCGDYKAPEKHYIDWFNEKYGLEGN